MSLIDGEFDTLTILRVRGETAFKGDGVVVLIGLACENEVLLSRQLTVQTVHAEVHTMYTLLYGREQEFGLAYRHRIDRTDGLFTLRQKLQCYSTIINFNKMRVLKVCDNITKLTLK